MTYYSTQSAKYVKMKEKFKPTWLMIKRHKKTGLLYFCKTYAYNPDKYKGSGEYWRLHLNKHDRDVEHVWKKLFYDFDEIMEFALSFSEIFNIIDDNAWANLVPEDGVSGHPPGTKQPQTQGVLNEKYDPTIHTFIHEKTGEVVQMTQSEFVNHFNLSRQNVNGVIKGRKKTVSGWMIPGVSINRKRVIIEGVVYSCMLEASKVLGITKASVQARVKSKNYPDYQYLVAEKQHS